MSEQKIDHHVVLGMAGHIDHGKTSIVKALTGTNTDRLKEEIERGMTIDLGFAFLGNDMTIIDVPGHEKFVKTMVAGVNTVDIALLVIAADDGIMPQTREHLEILNLLHVPNGIIAVNKIDIVEPDWLELVIDEVRTLVKGTVMEHATIVPISATKNLGIEQLKQEIARVSKRVALRHDKGVFRLLIDRIFSMKGFGTVVAGTVLSGKVAPEDMVELLPQKTLLRVRGVQVHEHSVSDARVGIRAAINVGGIEKESIERGDVLVEPGFFSPSYMFDAHFKLLNSYGKPLKNRTRIRLNIGTTEIIGRLVLLDNKEYSPGEEGYVQFHCEKPVVTDRGDRFVVRSYSPLRTIGGGVVLDPHPQKHKANQDEVLAALERIQQGDPGQVILECLDKTRFTPQQPEELSKSLGMPLQEVVSRIVQLETQKSIVRIGKKRIMTEQNYTFLKNKILSTVSDFHAQNPLLLGIVAAKLCQQIKPTVDRILFDEVLTQLKEAKEISVENDLVRLFSHTTQLNPKQVEMKNLIKQHFLNDPFNPPKIEDLFEELGNKIKQITAYMIDTGELVHAGNNLYFHVDAITSARELFTKHFEKNNILLLSDVREYLKNCSRNKMVTLLEYFDHSGFTVRQGEGRVLKVKKP